MKTLMCQLNTTPNDFYGNYKQVEEAIQHAFQGKYDLIVFPELTIPGYLCKDMMFRKGFVEQNLDMLKKITEICYYGGTTVIIGYIDRNYDGYGKPFRNMAAVIKEKRVIATYQKHLLPFYDVFDEGRYFEPGKSLTVIDVAGQKWGICICEDLWNDKGSDDYNYTFNPLEDYRKRGICNIISINSSPYVRNKPNNRMEMIKKSADLGTIIYCNQIGGQDELVFDGNSFIAEKGRIKACAGMNRYQEYDTAIEKDQWGSVVRDEPYDIIKLGLQDYLRKTGFKQVVVGSSGGIDSALVLALACDAIGPENVHGIRMPSVISSEHSKNDAKTLHDNLGCHDYLVPIDHNSIVQNILSNLKLENPNPKPIADENIQARLRGMILMYFSNAFNALLLSTGNKTELALGYCTLYGDMNGGFCPINDLYKMQVYEMALFYNKQRGKDIIPENILNKAPSAELAPGQTDAASLMPYPILDTIVKAYVESYVADFKGFRDYCFGAEHFASANNPMVAAFASSPNHHEASEYSRMIRLININEFKRRQAAPGIKITPVAFGVGRRLPIVQG